jgi:hypothetical protein
MSIEELVLDDLPEVLDLTIEKNRGRPYFGSFSTFSE